MEMKPLRNSSFSILVCNSDFSMTFNETKEIIIQSIQFKKCGKCYPLILIDTSGGLVMLVQVINVTFIQSGQSSLRIVSDIREIQVINSTFTRGRNDVDINFSGTVLKAIFKGTMFSHNRIGSIISGESLEESVLDINNCTFSNNVVTKFIIHLNSFCTIVIVSSCFEENFANNIIHVENAIIVRIVDTLFFSNVVLNKLILYHRSRLSEASFFFFDSIVRNNTAKLSDNGVLSVKGLQTYIRNSVFQKNVAYGSTLTISDSSLTVINLTIFDDNRASLKGGAVLGRAIQYCYVYRCNFSNNSADSGGALSIAGGAVVIEESYFNSNIAIEHGGALQVHAGMVNITGSHWFNNTSLRGDGGAISITSDIHEASLLEVHSCSFNLNKAYVYGGAVSLLSPVTFTSLETSFTTNYTSHGGAIIVDKPCLVTFWNCLIFNNTSERIGGALYVTK